MADMEMERVSLFCGIDSAGFLCNFAINDYKKTFTLFLFLSLACMLACTHMHVLRTD